MVHSITPIFLELSEALRLNGVAIPTDFAARIPILAWFILTRVTVMILRKCGHDSAATTIIGLPIYELLAVARIIAGSAHGKHRWGFLILMMVLGGLTFILRAQHFNKSDGSSWLTTRIGGCGDGGSGCGGGGGCGG